MGKGSRFTRGTKSRVAAKPLITPMRRFFFKLELINPPSRNSDVAQEFHGSATTLRAISEGEVLSIPSSPLPLLSSSPGMTKSEETTARIAIQQDDVGFDAVVITTLPNYPFCCHEDLLTMSSQQLITVAELFNARVPAINRIQIGENTSNASIRTYIESLLGIRPPTPNAPKAIKSCQSLSIAMDEDDRETDLLPSPPSSPLAMRGKRKHGMLAMLTSPPRLLERLDEEDEDLELSGIQRPIKKRKISGKGLSAKVIDASTSDDSMKKSTSTITLPLPLVSAGVQFAVDDESPTSRRVLRSHGVKSTLAERKKGNLVIDRQSTSRGPEEDTLKTPTTKKKRNDANNGCDVRRYQKMRRAPFDTTLIEDGMNMDISA